MALFQRRESPPYFSDYRKYKAFLQRDFLQRCAYCERTEDYLGGEDAFEVEHFKPKSKFPDLLVAYENLYYVCRRCNLHKAETWPSDDLLARGTRFADPCEEDLYTDHVHENEDGKLDALTSCGTYSSSHIRLNRNELQRWRRLRSEARNDLPLLTDLARWLDKHISTSDASAAEREEMAARLTAVRRRIDQSKRRFSIE
jgi:HNH endonuclease